MRANLNRQIIALAILAAGLLVGARARAATIAVPGNQPTIQDAIDNAAPGDTILVANGTFAEALVVDVDNLTLLSENGRDATTLATAPGIGTPMVEVQAAGFTLGAPGQGFTVIHEDLQAASIVLIDAVAAGQPATPNAAPTRIEANRILGNSAIAGIATFGVLGGTDLQIIGNVIAGIPQVSGTLADAVFLGNGDFSSSVRDASLAFAALEVHDNVMQDFTNSGVFLEGRSYGSLMDISSNAMTGAPGGASYGARMNGTLYEMSDCVVEGNSITNVTTGVSVVHCSNGAWVYVLSNSITDYESMGVFVPSIYYGSDVVVSGNTLAASGSNASGVRVNIMDEGCTLRIDDNEMSGLDDVGVELITTTYNPLVAVRNNTIDSAGGGGTGIRFGDVSASDVECTGNQLSGFSSTGIEIDEMDAAALLTIEGNTLNGASASRGVELVTSISDGSEFRVTGNAVSGFESAGISVYDTDSGAEVEVRGNALTALPAGTSTNGIAINDTTAGAILTIAENEIDLSGSDGAAIQAALIGEGADVIVSANSVTNFRTFGIEMTDGVEYGGSLTVSGNTLAGDPVGGATTAVRLDGSVSYGSDAIVIDNAISGFRYAGIYVNEITEGSNLVCDVNTISASDFGADYGIYVDYFYYGALDSSISGNTIRNIGTGAATGAGMYLGELYEGCLVDVKNNTVSAHPIGSPTGIELEYIEYGSILDVDGNTVSGFTLAGLSLDSDLYSNPILRVRNNVFNGGVDSVQMRGYLDSGAIMEVEANAMSGFTRSAVFFDDTIDAATVRIARNTMTGNSAEAAVQMLDEVREGSEVLIDDNCVSGVEKGVVVMLLLENASVTMRGNDLSAVQLLAAENVGSDADHPIDANDNFRGGAGVSGNVLLDRELADRPDLDGDGVPNCEDACPGTTAGALVNGDGCPVFGGGPGNGGPGNDNGPGGFCGASGSPMLLPFAMMGAAGLNRRRRHAR